jgi:hypothetical protein
LGRGRPAARDRAADLAGTAAEERCSIFQSISEPETADRFQRGMSLNLEG